MPPLPVGAEIGEIRMTRLPTLFVSHGAPTFALEPGRLGPQLTALGQALPRPAAGRWFQCPPA